MCSKMCHLARSEARPQRTLWTSRWSNLVSHFQRHLSILFRFEIGLRLGTTISACLDLRCRNETCLFAVLLQILNLARHWNEPGNHPGPAHFHGAGHLWSWHHPDGLCWCAYLLWLLHWQSHPIYKASFCYCLLIHATTALIDCTDLVPFCRE